MRLPPIAIFVYKRPDHTRRMLETVRANAGFEGSPVFVFCDGPKRPEDEPEVRRTREIVRGQLDGRAQIVERTQNMGLARSIIAGVTELVSRFGRVIVLEDDLLLSPATLGYFNAALERYEADPKVMHISAYMFPVAADLPQAFFYREATCWGWATWARAWQHFVADGAAIREYVVSRKLQHEFNVRGSMDFLGMLEDQIAGRVDSWAIRWYGTMFMKRGLALHPGHSLIQNIGFDGTGVNCGASTIFDVTVAATAPTVLPDRVEESPEALEAMIRFRPAGLAPRMRVVRRAYRKVRSWL